MVEAADSEIQGTGALAKALRLIRAVAAFDARGARLVDLQGTAGLGGPTAHRMLRRLVHEGMLEKGADNRYHLGRLVYELGLLATRRFDPREQAEPFLRALSAETAETVFLAMRSGVELVCLSVHAGDFPQALTMEAGTRRPLGTGASGVALLAAMPPEESDAIIRANRGVLTDYSPEMVGKLRHWVQFARRHGYAVTQSMFDRPIAGLGVVVPSEGLVPYLSISVVGITERLRAPRRRKLVEGLRQAAEGIAGALR